MPKQMEKSVLERCEESGVYEDSEVPTDKVPAQNAHESGKWNSDGYNQSGFKK